MCVDWLETAFSHSTSETLGVMQTYLVSKTRRKSSSLLDEKSDLMDIFTRFAKGSAISSAIIRSPSKHAKFLGEVNGIILIKEQEGMSRKDILLNISKTFREEIRALYRSADHPDFIKKLHDTLFRAAALILINETVESELVYLLCLVPKVKYSKAAMEIAVNAWAWVMASKPSLDRRMLAHMIQVWETVEREGEGLYSELERSVILI
jgi:PI4-kinase N-terminal region